MPSQNGRHFICFGIGPVRNRRSRPSESV